MLSKSDSPRYIAEEFGRRLKRLRLNKICVKLMWLHIRVYLVK